MKKVVLRNALNLYKTRLYIYFHHYNKIGDERKSMDNKIWTERVRKSCWKSKTNISIKKKKQQKKKATKTQKNVIPPVPKLQANEEKYVQIPAIALREVKEGTGLRILILNKSFTRLGRIKVEIISTNKSWK